MFKVPCFGCGMTRAFVSALRLDFASAFSYHPMFWSLPLIALYYWRDGKVFKSEKGNTFVFFALFIGFLFVGIMRIGKEIF